MLAEPYLDIAYLHGQPTLFFGVLLLKLNFVYDTLTEESNDVHKNFWQTRQLDR